MLGTHHCTMNPWTTNHIAGRSPLCEGSYWSGRWPQNCELSVHKPRSENNPSKGLRLGGQVFGGRNTEKPRKAQIWISRGANLMNFKLVILFLSQVGFEKKGGGNHFRKASSVSLAFFKNKNTETKKIRQFLPSKYGPLVCLVYIFPLKKKHRIIQQIPMIHHTTSHGCKPPRGISPNRCLVTSPLWDVAYTTPSIRHSRVPNLWDLKTKRRESHQTSFGWGWSVGGLVVRMGCLDVFFLKKFETVKTLGRNLEKKRMKVWVCYLVFVWKEKLHKLENRQKKQTK